MADVIFPQGIRFKRPHPKAPDFIKGNISIKREEMIEWLKGQTSEWINLDLKISKDNNPYLAVNTYVKSEEASPQDDPNLDL